ncbi:hypothetical protein V6N13_112302 [Hibiscus sabdariffa]
MELSTEDGPRNFPCKYSLVYNELVLMFAPNRSLSCLVHVIVSRCENALYLSIHSMFRIINYNEKAMAFRQVLYRMPTMPTISAALSFLPLWLFSSYRQEPSSPSFIMFRPEAHPHLEATGFDFVVFEVPGSIPCNLVPEITDLLEQDDKDAFVGYLRLKCATALLAGETVLDVVDINALDPEIGSNPLHFTSYPPELIYLYIRNGARMDIRCGGMLPLNHALFNISESTTYANVDWSSKQSICMVIVRLCLDMEILESIKVLFDHTKEVVKEVYHYVMGGKLLETTALLMVAREEITTPFFFTDFTSSGSMSLHQLVLLEVESLKALQIKLVPTGEEMQELGKKLETMNSMLHLIEVLQSVGPEIDQYRQDKPKLSIEDLATKVAYLLIRKGFLECEYMKSFISVSGDTFWEGHRVFQKLLGSKLHGENEGSQLESKDVVRKINDIVLLNLL